MFVLQFPAESPSDVQGRSVLSGGHADTQMLQQSLDQAVLIQNQNQNHNYGIGGGGDFRQNIPNIILTGGFSAQVDCKHCTR